MTDTSFSPVGTNQRAFRDALGRFATGVTVVTIPTLEGPMGFTANSFASVSLDPPLVLWAPARASMRFPYFAAARHYAIHVLGAEQLDLCRRFVRGGHGFDGLPYSLNPEGIPVIAGTLARFDCLHRDSHDGGDHLIQVAEVLRVSARAGAPLIFSQGSYGGFTLGLD